MDEKRKRIIGAIIGLIVGDALGVPVEFMPRESLKQIPVTGMRGYGTYNKPAGTWSDDSSMTIATMDSIMRCGGINVVDIANNFVDWLYCAKYTAGGQTFDVGNTTREALQRYMKTGYIRGADDEYSNGNGSLMRILPVVLWPNRTDKMLDDVGAITHAHDLSKLSCRVYAAIIDSIMAGGNMANVMEAIENVLQHDKTGEAEKLSRLSLVGLLPEWEINSSGYVVDSLEAVLWCVFTTDNYKDCVLKAVNLGLDTDTIAAIAGGIAGAFYGIDGIPIDWVNGLQRPCYVKDMAEMFADSVMEAIHDKD